MSVGFPTDLHLDVFGCVVEAAYNAKPYLVGSAAAGKGWRDVDVVVLIPERRFAKRFGSYGPPFSAIPRWAAECMAWSALGEKMTGLPIDFKVQPIEWANDHHDGPRHALTITGPVVAARLAP